MSAIPRQPNGNEPLDNEYEDLLGQWSDLESVLSMLLARPAQAQGFVDKIAQCDRWLQDLVAHDVDAALYLMFQLASTSTVGYSASHALVCGTLCHVLTQPFSLSPEERESLVRAAFTMNIGMTALQDHLAMQREPLTKQQRQAIDEHPQTGMNMLLGQLDVTDALWLDVVARHHAPSPLDTPLTTLAPGQRLARILSTIDRYAAMISPRKSRAGKSATDSVRAVADEEKSQRDEVGAALVNAVGLCPPGTFVHLDNGETAVVLRRGKKANLPLVACVLTARGEPLRTPTLHHTDEGQPRIEWALARSAVAVELNHRAMVRVGLYAAQKADRI